MPLMEKNRRDPNWAGGGKRYPKVTFCAPSPAGESFVDWFFGDYCHLITGGQTWRCGLIGSSVMSGGIGPG